MNEQPPRAARRRLIDELEAISETLGGEQPATAQPKPSAAGAWPLLDLGAIFSDDGLFDDGDAPLLFWPLEEQAPAAVVAASATDRSALIEQIVARLLPDLEQQLRDQLRGLDVESLRRLLR
jgi:mannose/cellobiose epimerase-like protein (N-acyl-D-glucosamine 2-epimerase family)